MTGASPKMLILMLLDMQGSLSVEELREHLPPGAAPHVFRLSDFGVPGIARTGSRPDGLDWAAVRRAVLALVQTVRLKARDRQVHYVVHGMAPLPVFAYLGLLLSAWAAPVTVINRRKDGTVDVCPLQGPRTSDTFFDIVEGLDLEAPVTRSGRVAVFVSTGDRPDEDQLRRFFESGSEHLAGLVQIRTSALRTLDQEHMATAADELARYLSLVPRVYAFQKGIALFITGPAQLALATGRAVNPTIITDVQIVNRGGGDPSGHELAFVGSNIPLVPGGLGDGDPRGPELAFAVSSIQPTTDDALAPTPAERPRIEELRITGFRTFEQAALRLSDFTALIGKNGAGKSTLLDAFDFLREAITDSLRNALDRRGGLAELRPRLSPASQGLGLALTITLPGTTEAARAPLETGAPSSKAEAGSPEMTPSSPTKRRAVYGFRLTTGFEGGLQIDEQLRLDGGPGFRRLAGRVESPITAVSRTLVPRDGLLLPLVASVIPAWRTILDVVSRFRVYTLSAARIREPASVGGGLALDREGGNACDVLVRLEGERADKDWLIDHLAAITPGIVDVKVGTSSGRRMLYFDQQPDASDRTAPGPSRFHAGEMSDGTLRALGILLACRQRPVPSLVLIDELEDSMHIGALHVLLDALGATVDDRCQVAITSHSTEVLSHRLVDPEHTRLIVWRDGKSGVFELDPGSRASAVPPDTVGSILRINGLYPADVSTGITADLFALDEEDRES